VTPLPLLDIVALGFAAAALGGVAFGSLSYVLSLMQSTVFAIELLHSLLAGALLGVLAESLTKVVPLQLVVFLYSLASSVLVAELSRRRVPQDVAVSLLSSLSAVLSVASAWYLAYVTPVGYSRAMAVVWGIALLVHPNDLAYLTLVALLVVASILTFNLELKYVSFDPDLAYVSGLNTRAYYYLVYTLVALTLSATVKIYGVVVAGVLIATPSVISVYLLRSYRAETAIAFSTIISLVGYSVSYLTGAQVSMCIGVISLALLTTGTLIRWLNGRRPNS
jgi:zinc transport system permease protein